MEMRPPPSSGRVIFREGLMLGSLLGIVHIGLSLLNQLLAQSGLGPLGLLLIVLLWLVVFFWAGVRGAKQTGRVGTGALTGLVTAVFAGVIAFVYLIVYALINVSSLSRQISDNYQSRGIAVPPNLTGTIFLGLAIVGIVLWLLGIGVGAGMGALGGLLGRSQSTVLLPPTYLDNPPYGYGQPPMQPPYPPPPYNMPPYQNQPPQWPQQ